MRQAFLRALPASGLLVPYFITIVLGNLIYFSPWGEEFLRQGGYKTDLLRFPESFSVGFFALLFAPFVVVPASAAIAGCIVRPLTRVLHGVPEIGRLEFAVVTAALLSVVFFVFWREGILALFLQGSDALSSVEARFRILEAIGLKTRIALHSVLWLLSLYAFIRALRERESFWIVSAAIVICFVAVGLWLLNMKWSVLVYFLALLVAVAAFTKRYVIATSVGAVLLAVAYVVVSASVLRISSDKSFTVHVEPRPTAEPAPQNTAPPPVIAETVTPSAPMPPPATAEVAPAASSLRRPSGLLSSLLGSTFALAVNPISRMAVSYPYYYSIFTREGPICGGPVSQVLPNPPCVPTWLVYTRISPEDKQFAGRGTSPASAHITGYALGGWPAAIIELVLVGLFLGACAALPIERSAVWGTVFVASVVMGYHWSQVPLEGPIIYDYGVSWSFFTLVLLSLVTWGRKRLTS